jgi:rhodanese-related sulfurtransferase
MPLMRLRDMADPRHPDFHDALKEQKPIAVYCASGARSHSAAQMLNQMGYDEVHNIGGLGHWAQAGGSIERI